MHNRISRWIAIAIFGLGIASGQVVLPTHVAIGQEAEDKDNGSNIVELEGKLANVTGTRLKLKSANGEETVVSLSGNTLFSYEGKAAPAFLSRGMMVRFTAAFDSAGVHQAPLTELEVFRPAKVKRMTREILQSQTPGIYPVTDKPQGNSKGKEKPGKKPAASTPTQPAGAQSYEVVGQLQMIQGDKLQVMAGRRPLIVSADPGLTIKVTSGDALFCRPGDKVTLKGIENAAGLIQAQTVSVFGTRPLGESPGGPGQRPAVGGGTAEDASAGGSREGGKRPDRNTPAKS